MNMPLILYIVAIIAAAIAGTFPSLSWLPLVAFLILLPLGATFIWRAEGRPLAEIGFSLPRSWLRFFAIGLVLGVGIPLLFLLIQWLGGWLLVSLRDESLSGNMLSAPQLLRLILVVAIEEYLYRGFFPNALNRKMGVGTAIVMSSILWGASHIGSLVGEGLSFGETAVALATFLAWGITLSLAYLIAKKSLWLPYGLHLGSNLAFSLLGSFFVIQPNAAQWWIGHPSWRPESGLIGPLVWAIIALVAYWSARQITGALTAKD